MRVIRMCRRSELPEGTLTEPVRGVEGRPIPVRPIPARARRRSHRSTRGPRPGSRPPASRRERLHERVRPLRPGAGQDAHDVLVGPELAPRRQRRAPPPRSPSTARPRSPAPPAAASPRGSPRPAPPPPRPDSAIARSEAGPPVSSAIDTAIVRGSGCTGTAVAPARQPRTIGSQPAACAATIRGKAPAARGAAAPGIPSRDRRWRRRRRSARPPGPEAAAELEVDLVGDRLVALDAVGRAHRLGRHARRRIPASLRTSQPRCPPRSPAPRPGRRRAASAAAGPPAPAGRRTRARPCRAARRRPRAPCRGSRWSTRRPSGSPARAPS